MKRLFDEFYPCPQDASPQKVPPAPPQTAGRFLTPAAQTPGLALHSAFTVNLPVASQHHQALLSGFCGRKVAPPPPHVRPKGFTGGKGCNRENRENREQQRKRRAESRAFQTLIPPARWSVRPPSRCWCRKGSY